MQATIHNEFLTLTVDTHGAEAVSLKNAAGEELLLPTICICITIFSLNFLGEGIGDAFNPKKTRG